MTRRQIAALSALAAAVFLVAVDGTVLAVAVPSLAEDLQPSYTQILWISDIYSFMLAGLLVTVGNLGDRVGRKRLLMFGVVGFGAMSVVAAYAPSAEFLIAARAIQGIAGATLMPSTLALIRTVFTERRQRTLAVGIWSSTGSAGAAIGPFVAGLLLEHYSWGSVFLINVPVVIFILAVGLWALPESRGDAAQPIDLLSVVLSIVGILALVFAIKELARGGWTAPSPWLALLIGVPMLIAFMLRQRRLPVPLLDVSLFRIPLFAGSVLAEFVMVFAATGLLFFLALYFQFVAEFSPLQAGLALLPVSLVALVVAPIAARLSHRLSPRVVLLAGLWCTAIGLGLIALVAGRSYPWFILPMMMVGFGFGSVVTVASDQVISSAPEDRTGAAGGISETAFELGSAMGIALLGSLLTLVYRGGLQLPAGVPADLAARAQDSLSNIPDLLVQLPAATGDALLSLGQQAFTAGLAVSSAAAALLVVVSAAVAGRMLPGRGSRGAAHRGTDSGAPAGPGVGVQ